MSNERKCKHPNFNENISHSTYLAFGVYKLFQDNEKIEKDKEYDVQYRFSIKSEGSIDISNFKVSEKRKLHIPGFSDNED